MESNQSSSDEYIGNSGLNIATFNLHGFKRNWSYLQELTVSNDIIFVQEHWLLTSNMNCCKKLILIFLVFAKSLMNERSREGLLNGRPFGGVAVFIRKTVSHIVNFCNSDQDGKVICVKILNDGLSVLVFGCYFPCNDHSSTYLDKLSRVLGYIDSVAACNPGFRVCILGDLNFECVHSNPGFAVFNELASDYSLVSCDDLCTNDIDFTYHHKTLNQKSFIDHVFIGPDLKSRIDRFTILDESLNLSDHLPVVFHIAFSEVNCTVSEPRGKTCIRELRWDKGNLNEYYYNTGNLLSRINHVQSCDLSACLCYDHTIDIGIYYCELVHALTFSAVSCIPRVPTSALKHYWSATLDDLKRNSKDAFDLWVLGGKPHSGTIFDLMKDAKYKYKLAVRHAVSDYENRFSDELYEHLLSKDMTGFWKTWSAKTSNKVFNVPNIDGEVNDGKIAEVFRCKFEGQAGVCNSLLHAVDPSHDDDDDVSKWMLTVEDVDYVIRNNMKCGKAAGVDNLTMEHIVYSHPSIILHLCKLFNLMLKHGYVPDQFGRGIVIPLVKDKNGDVTNSENYRGITVSPVMSKIF